MTRRMTRAALVDEAVACGVIAASSGCSSGQTPEEVAADFVEMVRADRVTVSPGALVNARDAVRAAYTQTLAVIASVTEAHQ